MNLYLVVLKGAEEVEIKLVEEEIWSWMHTDPPIKLNDKNRAVSENIPEPIKKKLVDWLTEGEDDFHYSFSDCSVNINIGEYTNDRALVVPPAKIDGKYCFWSSLKEYTNFIKSHKDVDIIDEFDGYIY